MSAELIGKSILVTITVYVNTHTKVRRRPDRVTRQLLHTHTQTSKNSMKLDTINVKSLLQLVCITTGITVLVGTKNS